MPLLNLKRFIFPFFLLLVTVNLLLASGYVLQGDILFSSDIARDFFLLEELDQKKVVLIGPRSSVGGLFHGPLWLYLTYPGYVLGNGNPVVMGWYWICLIAVFLVSCYFIGKALFNKETGILFTLMMSAYMIYHANGLFNPHGAMFLLPAFFYTIVKYVQTKKVSFLLIHFLIAGCMIQFQMAIGMPFTFLSLLLLGIISIKKKTYTHLLTPLILLIPLSTFFLFDLRHDFILTQNVFRHLGTSDATQTFTDLLSSRIQAIFSSTEFLRYGLPNGSFYVFLVFTVFLLLQIKHNIHRQIYLLFLYFYIGFFTLSLINRYELLYFYIFPVFPLVFLMFSSFVTSKYRLLFTIIFFTVYLTNIVGGLNRIQDTKELILKDEESWKGLFAVSQSVFQNEKTDFGYFVYSPDVLGYGPRYAMHYANRLSGNRAKAFEKRPITYLIIAPPPRNNPFMKDEWWRINQLRIQSQPEQSTSFPNGYRVQKIRLDDEDLSVPFDNNSNPGIHFR